MRLHRERVDLTKNSLRGGGHVAGANRQKVSSPRTVIEFARSNAQCEQFDRTDTDHEHCERYGIVVQPIPLGLHDTPPCPASLVAPTGEWFKCDADD